MPSSVTTLSDADRAAITAIINALETAWNTADGDAFAAPFTADADFVNVRAEHHRGRAAIVAGHNAILGSIYAGSVNRYEVASVRLLNADVALVHVNAALDVPAGPLAGHLKALFSAVLVRTAGTWEIASFHNTMQPPPGR